MASHRNLTSSGPLIEMHQMECSEKNQNLVQILLWKYQIYTVGIPLSHKMCTQITKSPETRDSSLCAFEYLWVSTKLMIKHVKFVSAGVPDTWSRINRRAVQPSQSGLYVPKTSSHVFNSFSSSGFESPINHWNKRMANTPFTGPLSTLQTVPYQGPGALPSLGRVSRAKMQID